jgi:hypothetical protein
VNTNDPVNSVLVLEVLATAGLEADAVLRDKDDFAAVVAGATDFVTNGGYARKTLDQAGGITITVNDALDRIEVDFPDQTYTAIVAGSGWSKFLTGFDSDSTAGTDANVVPWTLHDLVVTPDGSDITVQVADIFRATSNA